MILMIDNYDSFTFNLVQYLGELGHELKVLRNDAVTPDEIAALSPQFIVVSPGPGRPEDSGVIIPAIKRFAGKIPILGVCLGHQAIGAAFGGDVVSAPQIMHGKTSQIHHDGKSLFKDLPNPFTATRYHSLVVAPESLPDCLEVSAKTEDGVIMGLRHKEFMVEGVQFHPESILTEVGMRLLANFVGARHCGSKT
ncbi:MAG: aminodeoxychorismate/anthranilate synthase component II [Acidobacteriota bacterium]|jgi:anthranilate synthase/aminodeoxychorismate synthase-like glutamine amidotransferase|nr:aminodeoxychorismate/anthranilate synthase component II [Acidobacteriota bacterium]